MHELLNDGDRPRVVVLCGLGGVGKSSLAAEYAHRHWLKFAVVWQVAAEDSAVMATDLAELAAQIGAREMADPRDPVASAHAVLAAYPAEWLLIFDNAPDEASVRRFVPTAGPGRVVITSQSQHWPHKPMLDVPVLDEEVAAGFLISRTGDPDCGSARILAEELGGLPLALEQAAAFIQATNSTIAGYLSLYRQRQADLMDRGEASGHPATLAATLMLVLTRLESDAPAAVPLLRLLACLAPEPTPLHLLLARSDTGFDPDPETAEVLGPMSGDLVVFWDAIASLRKYSLITKVSQGMFVMHRLVQAVTSAQMSPAQVSRFRRAAAAVIEAVIPADTDQPDAWPSCALLLPHAQAALGPEAGGMRRIAAYLGESGNYPAARDQWQDINRASEQILGPRHPDTLSSQHDHAYWTGVAGDAAAARDQFAALLPVREQVLGPEHRDSQVTRHQLARWTGEAGDAAAARDLFTALLRLRERILGQEHPDTLATRSALARWTGATGDAASARDQLAIVLPIEEQVRGCENTETLYTRHNLADWTGKAGDPATARDLFAALFTVRVRIRGPEHPDTLSTRHNLACWTREAGDPATARDLFAALLPICERVLGPHHPDTQSTRDNLANCTRQTNTQTPAIKPTELD